MAGVRVGLVLGAVGLAAAAVWIWQRGQGAAVPPVVPAAVAPDSSSEEKRIWLEASAAPEGPLTDKASPVPLHKTSPYAPGTRIPITKLPKVTRGIRLPDGSLLPFLNGMTAAPPLQRDPSLGPVQPVVAKVVDSGGFEWWEHADGSMTTTRYKSVTVQGQQYWDPGTDHAAKLPEDRLRGVDKGPAPDEGK